MSNLDFFMNRKEIETLFLEAQPLMKNRRVAAFRELDRDSFLLILEGEEHALPRMLRLKVRLSRGLTGAYITSHPTPRRGNAAESPFARSVDQELSNLRLAWIEIPAKERIVTLLFDDESREGRRLVIELFGSRSNLFLLDENDVILEALRRPRPLPGGEESPWTYSPPETGRLSRAQLEIRFPSPADDAAASGSQLPLNDAASRFFESIAGERALHRLRGSLASGLARQLRKARKKVRETEGKIAAARDAEEIRRQGDLLKANFHLMHRGMSSIQVDDFSVDPPASVEIRLDPKLLPAENIEIFYRRYKKVRKSVPPLEKLLEATRRSLAELESRQKAVEAAPSIEALEEIAAEIAPPRQQGTAAPRQAGTGGQAIRRFRSEQGFDILVGRSGETNHRLTFQISRGNDIWMHCHEAPGSHVIISLKRGQTAPLDTLLAAGRLAIHFSKRRGAGRADVIYTHRKYVRPVKGGGKGKVFAERFKTLHIKHCRESLQKILDSAASP